MTDPYDALRNRVQLSRRAAVASWLLLYAMLTLMSFQVTPAGSNPVTIWLFQTTPLLCFLPGLFRANPRTHLWLCFLSMIYFIQGVLTANRPAYLYWGLAEALLAIALFSAALLYARWATDLQKAQA